MNEIDFSQLEKLQKQMESADYTKACVSAMNVISQKALKYISNVTKARDITRMVKWAVH